MPGVNVVWINKQYTKKRGDQTMKKLAVLLGVVGMLMLAVSMAQAQSDWAYYKENPVKICENDVCYIVDGYTGPRLFTDGEVDGDRTLYYLNCCACHGLNAPGNHGGPQFPFCP